MNLLSRILSFFGLGVLRNDTLSGDAKLRRSLQSLGPWLRPLKRDGQVVGVAAFDGRDVHEIEPPFSRALLRVARGEAERVDA